MDFEPDKVGEIMQNAFAVAEPGGASSEYIYLSNNKPLHVKEDSVSLIPPMAIDRYSLGILLDSGVLPSPKTPYKNLFVLNAGDSLNISSSDDSLFFGESFPFLRSLSAGNTCYLNDFESHLIAAAQKTILSGAPALLFLSGGKDSAALACALSQVKEAKDLHCITYQSETQDESHIAKKIARRLGLSHETVDIKRYRVDHQRMESYFASQLLPSLDLCSTIYLHCGLDRFASSTLVDGMGNDLFIGHIPSEKEYRFSEFQKWVPYPVKRTFGRLRRLHQGFVIGSKTRSEMVGMWTFLSGSGLVDDLAPYHLRRDYWESVDRNYAEHDYFDLRASLRGRYIDQEKFIRKIKNAAAAYGLKLALPWTASELANYCHNLKDEELFDRGRLMNKIFLRKYLTQKLGIDYFAEKKYTFSYNYKKFVIENSDFVRDLVYSAKLFDQKLIRNYYIGLVKKNNYGAIYQLFLLLGWHQFSRFVMR
ncbi:asparagine synthase-related protein [uncultured Thiobacillus sp.]|uniref:asparagine synthase-related protein n=1 Tax=uncultured Thiobacillus sp. TaxID=189996 RepID=UPI0026135E48|nr:asparagine synthase-related protein [uncultured Thiobacillus sp.]